MPKLSKRIIELAEPETKDSFLWDNDLAGFGLKVTPNGRKTFVLQYRHGRRSRRMTIGQFGAFTVEQARAAAQAALRQIARGDDPMAERNAKKSEVATGALLGQFVEQHADARLKDRSAAEYKRLIEKLVSADLKRTPITEVSRSDLSRLHSSLSATPYQANRLLAVLRKFFNWCEANGFRQDHTNPTFHIKPYKEKKRERFLSTAEIGQLGDTLAQAEERENSNPFVIAAIRLLMLTGARLNEILSAKWEWVDFENGCIRLPDSKTGAKTIYLSPPAMQVLNSIQRLDGNPYIICGQKPGSHLINLQKPWSAIRSNAGLDDVRIHDLRHSFASVAVASGMSLPMIGKLLGHTQAQTTARYAHLADDPMKQAVGEIGRRMRLLPTFRVVESQ